jgi:hypothetical protein
MTQRVLWIKQFAVIKFLLEHRTHGGTRLRQLNSAPITKDLEIERKVETIKISTIMASGQEEQDEPTGSTIQPGEGPIADQQLSSHQHQEVSNISNNPASHQFLHQQHLGQPYGMRQQMGIASGQNQMGQMPFSWQPSLGYPSIAASSILGFPQTQQGFPPFPQHASSVPTPASFHQQMQIQQLQMHQQMQMQQLMQQQCQRKPDHQLGLLLQLQQLQQHQYPSNPAAGGAENRTAHNVSQQYPTSSILHQLPGQSMSNPQVALAPLQPPVRTAPGPPVQKPKRPLTAYNIFFRDERANLLQAKAAAYTSSDDEVDEEIYNHEKGTYRKKRKSTSKNKVGFEDMARHVSKMWQVVDAETKAKYLALAAEDKVRYTGEKVIYEQSLPRDEQLGSTVSENAGQKSLSSNKGTTKKGPKKPRKKARTTEE